MKLFAGIQNHMLRLTLYSTSHCHLCEQAEEILKSIAVNYALEWEVIEIVDDEQLLLQYGLIIPVIRQVGTEVQLNWPFSMEDIIQCFKPDLDQF
jgi:hypothetical protein